MVLTALGSGERLFALLPLAILSVGSVAGLAAMTDDHAATTPSPADPGAAAGSVGHAKEPRRVLARVAPSSSPAATPASPKQVVTTADPGPSKIDEESTEQSAGALVETPATTDGPASEGPAAPAPTSSATSTPDPAGSDSITDAEATAHCVASGITTTDVSHPTACAPGLLD